MDFTAVINNKLSFGRYPYDEKSINELEANGYTIFVNLTTDNDNTDKTPLISYESMLCKHSKYYLYPIVDRKYPTDIDDFKRFIQKVLIDMFDNDNIYIHCRGGHGRAGVVAAIFLIMQRMTPQQALDEVYIAHQNRIKMNPKWRKKGSPQTAGQKRFVLNFKNS